MHLLLTIVIYNLVVANIGNGILKLGGVEDVDSYPERFCEKWDECGGMFKEIPEYTCLRESRQSKSRACRHFLTLEWFRKVIAKAHAKPSKPDAGYRIDPRRLTASSRAYAKGTPPS